MNIWHDRTYLFVFECLHQLSDVADSQWKSEVRPCVRVWHLDALVAEVRLPFYILEHLVLSEYVGDQVPWEQDWDVGELGSEIL